MEIASLPTNTSEIHLHVEQLLQNTYLTVVEHLRLPKRYIFFSFSLFVSVYVCAPFCDFLCIAFLLPFVLGFCLFVSVFIFFLYSFWGLLSLVDMFLGLVALFSFFFTF